jgi:hypothetical protein
MDSRNCVENGKKKLIILKINAHSNIGQHVEILNHLKF